MLVFVFTPTRLNGGLDVTFSCLANQSFLNDPGNSIHWCVADELLEKREERIHPLIERLCMDIGNIDFSSFKIPRVDGFNRNLAASYNYALDMACGMGADLFISLQDYIWIPSDAVENIVKSDFDLTTTICHHSQQPTVADIINPDGLFSCFLTPWDGSKPEGVSWRDCRAEGVNIKSVEACTPTEWETNFASISSKAFFDRDLRFDESYDRYGAYENQDYAERAKELGLSIGIDRDIECITMTHRDFFPELTAKERAEGIYDKQMAYHHKRYNIPMPS